MKTANTFRRCGLDEDDQRLELSCAEELQSLDRSEENNNRKTSREDVKIIKPRDVQDYPKRPNSAS